MTDTLILSTAWINRPASGQREQTLLIGAAALTVSYRFGTLSFRLTAHSTTAADDSVGTMVWLADQLHVPPARLLLWRADDIVVPSLIAAAETGRDPAMSVRLLREVDLTLTGEVIDVATTYGGAGARSFDAVAHAANVPFVPLPRAALADAYRTGDHSRIRHHLAARAKATWRLFLARQTEVQSLVAATEAWVNTPDAEVPS